MKSEAVMLGCLTAAAINSLYAAEGPTPGKIPHLDHVFVAMVENHGYSQILNNPKLCISTSCQMLPTAPPAILL
jgi:hypothetical protein